jgi:hypothetical protein
MAYISGQIREKLASKDDRSFAVKMMVFKNVVRGFSLVHDPEGSHYTRVFKNVVAQFIGQMRLMNQATTEIWG